MLEEFAKGRQPRIKATRQSESRSPTRH